MNQQQDNQLALVQVEDLALVNNNVLNEKQLAYILKPTAPQYIKQRPAKGGGQWAYISGGYVRKVLNLMFGWNWDFEIMEDKEVHGHIVVLGRLTVRTGGATITKTQYGDKDIVYENDYLDNGNGGKVKKKSDRVLDIGNDYKAAATDALKKCAAEFGIGADVYNKEEFRAINIDAATNDQQQPAGRQHPQPGTTKQWAHLEQSQQQTPPSYVEPVRQEPPLEVMDFVKPHLTQQPIQQTDSQNNFLDYENIEL